MTHLPEVAAIWLFLVGLYGVATSRHLLHLAVCLTVVQSSTYVLLLAVGYRKGATAPIFLEVSVGSRAVDPVVQALTLTDVVVGAAVFAFLLALAMRARKHSATLDPDELTVMEG